MSAPWKLAIEQSWLEEMGAKFERDADLCERRGLPQTAGINRDLASKYLNQAADLAALKLLEQPA